MFSTSVNSELFALFQKKCEEDDIKQNFVIESFMRAFVNGDISIKAVLNMNRILDN